MNCNIRIQFQALRGALVVLLIFVIPFSVLFAQNMNSVDGDRIALLEIYEQTNGKNWINNSGWDTKKPLGLWYGVKTDSQGRVIVLNLSNNNLIGKLPDAIGNLTVIEYLNVKQNYLEGSIPSTIGNMANLKYLLLNGRAYDMNTEVSYHPGKTSNGTGSSERTNQFYGPLPKSIGNLEKLLYLEITGRGQERVKDGSGYPKSLTGPIPDEIGNLKNLRGLQLGFNSLNSIPKSIQNLTELIHLGIQGNALANHGFPSKIAKLTKLETIWIGNNQLGGKIPDLSELKNLKVFIAPFNNLEGVVPSYFFNGSFPMINMVNLSWNNLSGQLPDFSPYNNLKALQVDGNKLTGHLPNSIIHLGKMINFSLSQNQFTGTIPDLAHMKQLRYFRGNNNNFSGQIPMFYLYNESLQFIHLQNNSLSGIVPSEFALLAQLPKFKELDIRNNNFQTSDLSLLIEKLKDFGKTDMLRL